MSQASVIRPDAVVNQEESAQLARMLTEAVNGDSPVVVVDCRDVEYINSSGIGAIMEAYMQLTRRGGALRIVSPRGVVRKGFETVGILSFVETYDSLEDARRPR